MNRKVIFLISILLIFSFFFSFLSCGRRKSGGSPPAPVVPTEKQQTISGKVILPENINLNYWNNPSLIPTSLPAREAEKNPLPGLVHLNENTENKLTQLTVKAESVITHPDKDGNYTITVPEKPNIFVEVISPSGHTILMAVVCIPCKEKELTSENVNIDIQSTAEALLFQRLNPQGHTLPQIQNYTAQINRLKEKIKNSLEDEKVNSITEDPQISSEIETSVNEIFSQESQQKVKILISTDKESYNLGDLVIISIKFFDSETNNPVEVCFDELEAIFDNKRVPLQSTSVNYYKSSTWQYKAFPLIKKSYTFLVKCIIQNQILGSESLDIIVKDGVTSFNPEKFVFYTYSFTFQDCNLKLEGYRKTISYQVCIPPGPYPDPSSVEKTSYDLIVLSPDGKEIRRINLATVITTWHSTTYVITCEREEPLILHFCGHWATDAVTLAPQFSIPSGDRWWFNFFVEGEYIVLDYQGLTQWWVADPCITPGVLYSSELIKGRQKAKIEDLLKIKRELKITDVLVKPSSFNPYAEVDKETTISFTITHECWQPTNLWWKIRIEDEKGNEIRTFPEIVPIPTPTPTPTPPEVTPIPTPPEVTPPLPEVTPTPIPTPPEVTPPLPEVTPPPEEVIPPEEVASSLKVSQIWNGRDKDGKIVCPGIYTIIISAGCDEIPEVFTPHQYVEVIGRKLKIINLRADPSEFYPVTGEKTVIRGTVEGKCIDQRLLTGEIVILKDKKEILKYPALYEEDPKNERSLSWKAPIKYIWDGKDKDGKTVSPGIYTIKVWAKCEDLEDIAECTVEVKKEIKLDVTTDRTSLHPSDLKDLKYNFTTQSFFLHTWPDELAKITIRLEGGDPEGETIVVTSESVEYSGGHKHPNRPKGDFYSSPIVAKEYYLKKEYTKHLPGEGVFTVYYLPSKFGGTEKIIAKVREITKSISLNIEVALLSFGEEPEWTLIGHTGTTTYEKCYGAPIRHSDSHNASLVPNAYLRHALRKFYKQTKIRTGVNDMSLPQGGLFDICSDWAPGHTFHRTGRSVDINGLSEVNVTKLTFIMKQNNFRRYSEATIHYEFVGP